MSIKTTKEISRDSAIDRIKTVYALINDKDYVSLEKICFESGEDLQFFVDSKITFDVSNINKWTNEMLESFMDRPFFRYSMFENYIVV